MRRLKKDTYEWLREYAAHYSNKDFGLLVQQIESVPPNEDVAAMFRSTVDQTRFKITVKK